MAGWFSRVGAAWRTKSTSIEEWFRAYANQKTPSGIIITQTVAMQVATVYACVTRRAQDLAKLPIQIYRTFPNGSRAPAKDHPLYKLLQRPNDYQSWMEFAEQMQISLLLRGNAIAPVLRDAVGNPVAMIPVNPDLVQIWQSPGGEIFYVIARNTLFLRGILEALPMRIASVDILHLKLGSSDILHGLSPITLAADSIGLAKAQETLSGNLMGSGARPSGTLSTDKKMTDDAIKRLRAQWDSLNAGLENMGKTVILEQGMAWNPLTMNSVDMEFIASRRFEVEEICRIFHVNPAKVGVSVPGMAYNDMQLGYYQDAIHPDMVRWEQKLAHYFNLPADMAVDIDETELLRADLLTRANAARVLQVSGINKPNESRVWFNLPPDPNGDTLFIPNNVVPIDQAVLPPPPPPAPKPEEPGKSPGSDQTGAPAEGGDGDPTKLPDMAAQADLGRPPTRRLAWVPIDG